ncbi:MAG: glycosyltransferase [bacterium]
MEHVLHVLASLNRGGAETRIVELYREIDRNRLQFDFLVHQPGEHSYDEAIKSMGGLKYTISDPRAQGVLVHFIDILRMLRREGPFRAVHAHTSYHAGLALLAARLAGVKYRVAHARTTSTFESRRPIKRMIVALGRALIRANATSLLAISEDAAKFVFGNRVVRQGRVTIVPNAINLEPYACLCEDDNLAMRKQLAIPRDALVLGHVGRFSFMKNQEFLLIVLGKLRASGVDARLILVGDGERRRRVESLSRNAGIDEFVNFLGVRDDIARLNRMFDVYAMPSLFEGLGGAAIEAQAAGTPCVLAQGIPKSVDMGLGLVEFLSLNDAQEWADAVLRDAGKPRVPFVTICDAFQRLGFTIVNERQMFLSSYGMKLDDGIVSRKNRKCK